MKGSKPTVSVIIPVLNAERWADRQMEALNAQSYRPFEVLVLDSESTDRTVAAFSASGARVVTVKRSEFNHGTVRNRAVAMTTSEILVFATQDAIPADGFAVEQLVAPLIDGGADASYARQLPYSNASASERFARAFNYPPASQVRCSRSDIGAHDGVFFSNAFSAVTRSCFDLVGGFPTDIVTNEDMLFSLRLLDRGGCVAYVATSLVYHSHELSLFQTLRRYFDIGTFFVDACDELPPRMVGSKGTSFVLRLFRHMAQEGAYLAMARAAFESLAKGVGYALGRGHSSLPLNVVRLLSNNPQHWGRER